MTGRRARWGVRGRGRRIGGVGIGGVGIGRVGIAGLLGFATLLGTAGCAAPREPAFVLPPAPDAGEVLSTAEPAPILAAAGLRVADPSAAAWQRVEMAYEVRPALVTSAQGWRWRGVVPRDGRLVLGLGAPAATWLEVDRLELTVTAHSVDGEGAEGAGEVLAQAALLRPPAAEPKGKPLAAGPPPQPTPEWRDLEVNLSAYAGRELELTAMVAASPATASTAAAPFPATRVAWSPLYLGPPPGGPEHLAKSPSRAAGDERPNVLLIVVDTLRADHLGAYGYDRDTSPRIDQLLAGRGVVAEQAWAQAPWTLPSAVSYLTGRYPGELLSDLRVEFAIPPGVPSLAERFRRLGYRTAGFYANPTLHAGNGFARGFETFYTPEPTTASLRLHGDTLTRRAVPWLKAHAAEPFFVYVHFIDPHDPYSAPVTEATGGSPFDPGYSGRVNGDWPHGLFTGQLELDDPERDLAHLVALYDSEIKYVDQQIGHLIHALPQEVLANTLVVLTADHGEELFDHGWWKHGVSVYEEQLRVPLVVRWDDRLPAGGRVATPVELVDLVPTLLAAAGEEVREDTNGVGAGASELDGVDLLPLLAGGGPAGRADGFAQHLSSGPLRAAVRLGDWKLVLFDRQARFDPDDSMQKALYRVALERFQRIELYDLAADPGEERDVAAAHPKLVERLAPLVLRQLDAQGRPGLRLALGALPRGSRLSGEIRFRQPPEGWASDFLAAEDEVSLQGAVLRVDLVGEGWPKGLRVLGDPAGIAEIVLRVDGEAVAPGRVAVGERRWSGDPLAAAALRAEGWPPAAGLDASARSGGAAARAPLVSLWLPSVRRTETRDRTGDDAMARETERRLRALGYIQ